MAKNRDNFSPATKRLLAERVGHRCSRPGCPRLTIGPAQGALKAVILGRAAHITAAASGGPRFNAALTPAQRSHYDNGIWLCNEHADLIDRDEQHFKEEDIRAWKEQAEDRQFKEIDDGYQGADIELEEIDIETRQQLGLPDVDNISALLPPSGL